MTRAFDDLVNALERSALIAQFAVEEREIAGVETRITRGANASTAWRETREWHDRMFDIAVYRDLENGRGSARIHLNQERLPHEDRSWQQRIAEWVAGADATLELPWTLPPSAAPARVDIADPALAADLHAGSDAILVQLSALVGSAGHGYMSEARVECRAETIEVRTSHGFRHIYQGTTVTVECTVALHASSSPRLVERIRVCARRPADLALDNVIRRAMERLVERARATPTPPGIYDLVLERDALTPLHVSTTSASPSHAQSSRGPGADEQYAWFAPLVAHADSRWARHGLTRYQPGQSIYGNHPRTGDPLTVICDNTAPMGLYSRPVGDFGAPSRRFAVIKEGVAAGLSLSLREAALRGRPANGGIGNLQIAPGPTNETELARPGSRPLVRVTAIDHLDVDPPSGAFVATIGLGRLSSPDDHVCARLFSKPGIPVAGGVIRGNIFELLASARFSSRFHASGWYRGPSAIRFHGLAIASTVPELDCRERPRTRTPIP